MIAFLQSSPWLALFIAIGWLPILAACGAPQLKGVMARDLPKYHLIVGIGIHAADIVDQHCHRLGGKFDDGTTTAGRRIRACTTIYPRSLILRRKRKPVIVISQQDIGCVVHEECHALNLGDEKFCMQHYPCVQDIR